MVGSKSDGHVLERVSVPASRVAALYLNIAFITPMMFIVPGASVTGVALRLACAILFSLMLLNSSRRFLGIVVTPKGFTARTGFREVFVSWENVEAVRPAWFRMIRMNTTVGLFYIPGSIEQNPDATAIVARLDPDHPLRRALAA
jgi:hypothetical protein